MIYDGRTWGRCDPEMVFASVSGNKVLSCIAVLGYLYCKGLKHKIQSGRELLLRAWEGLAVNTQSRVIMKWRDMNWHAQQAFLHWPA